MSDTLGHFSRITTAVENITDAGLFENLALDVLRLKYPNKADYILHSGCNAHGQTISDPIDGLCCIPNVSPPHFLIAEFTITDRKSLKNKWLGPNGDLHKALELVSEIRKIHNNAKFTIYLCTNKEPNSELNKDIQFIAIQENVVIEFLTRTIISATLDINPEGQYVRKKYFDFEVERLSLSLLKNISSKNLNEYEKQFLFCRPQDCIITDKYRALQSVISSTANTIFIEARSGLGKSVLCYQMLKRNIDNNGISLWISQDIIEQATTLQEAIDGALKAVHPALCGNAGIDALQLVNGGNQLHIVIDDINKSNNKINIIEKIISWGKYNDKDARSAFILIIPVWTMYVHEMTLKECKWASIFSIGQMTDNDAFRCFKKIADAENMGISDSAIKEYVAQLSNDPILIKLFISQVKGKSMREVRASKVIANYIDFQIRKIASANGILPENIFAAINEIATYIIKNRVLTPSINALSRNQIISPYLQLIFDNAAICIRDSNDCVLFRHDRLLEHILSCIFYEMLSERDANEEYLAEPYYIELVGVAIARKIHIEDSVLDWLYINAPAVLFSALKHYQGISQNNLNRIVQKATLWVEKHYNSSNSLSWWIARLLGEIDNPIVLGITKSKRRDFDLSYARAKHGDVESGIYVINSIPFAVGCNFPHWDSKINYALENYKCDMCDYILREYATKVPIQEKWAGGLLVMIGYIGDSRLLPIIKRIFEQHHENKNLFFELIWSSLRCFKENNDITDKIILSWAVLPNKTEDDDLSKNLFLDNLKWSIRKYGLPEEAVEHLIVLSKTSKAVHWLSIYSFAQFDNIKAIVFQLEYAAKLRPLLKKGINFWLVTFGRAWNPLEQDGNTLSKASRDAIRNFFESNKTSSKLKHEALELWVKTTTDIAELQSVSNSLKDYEIVLHRRMVLGDKTVIPLLKHYLGKKTYWWRVLAKVWTHELISIIDAELATIDNSDVSCHTLAELLRDIPKEDAEPLLNKHWNVLKNNHFFIYLALYIGTEQCIMKVKDVLRGQYFLESPFKYISLFFGFRIRGLNDRLSFQHIKILFQFLEYLDDRNIADMVDFCINSNQYDWALKFLKPEMEIREKKCTDEHLIKTDNYFFKDQILIDILDNALKTPPHLLHDYHFKRWLKLTATHRNEIFQEWYGDVPDIMKYYLICNILQGIGVRDDIAFLNSLPILDTEEFMSIRENTIFDVKRRYL